jgi:hypothetical protein
MKLSKSLILSESELAKSWNKQADEFNQWESLGLDERLAWAQEQAISACYKARLAP